MKISIYLFHHEIYWFKSCLQMNIYSIPIIIGLSNRPYFAKSERKISLSHLMVETIHHSISMQKDFNSRGIPSHLAIWQLQTNNNNQASSAQPLELIVFRICDLHNNKLFCQRAFFFPSLFVNSIFLAEINYKIFEKKERKNGVKLNSFASL